MDDDERPLEVRCPGERFHTVNGVEYKTCGALFFGIDIKIIGKIFIKCKICKKTICVISDGKGEITKTEVTDRIEFKR